MKNLAVFTIMRHEPHFAPVWLEHYTSHVPSEDIFVLRHRFQGYGATEDDEAWLEDAIVTASQAAGEVPVNRLPVFHATSFDHEWLLHTVAQFQRFLLRSYAWVLFAEADELIVPRDGQSLHEWVNRHDRSSAAPVVRADGYEVVHRAEEPALDWSRRPLLPQRHWWYRSKLYSKPCLSSIPLTWEIGFHDAPEARGIGASTGLVLAHLHKIDFETALFKARDAARGPLNRVDVERGHGFQNYEEDERRLRWYFDRNIDTVKFKYDPAAQSAELTPIPDGIRKLI